MSIYQFNSYLNDISELEGVKPKQKDTTTTEDLMRMAKKKGIKTPTKF